MMHLMLTGAAGATRPKLAPEQNQRLRGVCCVLSQQIVSGALGCRIDRRGQRRAARSSTAATPPRCRYSRSRCS